MKPILMLALWLFVPAHTGNSAVSQHGEQSSEEIEEYVERAVHSIEADRAMDRVDLVMYRMVTQRRDSLEKLLQNQASGL